MGASHVITGAMCVFFFIHMLFFNLIHIGRVCIG
jgi:hypothetical protein